MEGDFQESVLFLHCGFWDQTQATGVEVDTLTHSAISPSLLSYVTENYGSNYHMAYVIIVVTFHPPPSF